MASQVFFTTNPADFERLEGLYVSERNPPGFIRGRDLSQVGIGGKCVRGPLTVQKITSTARFTEIYGERDFGSGGALQGEIWKALLNKPFSTLYVRRVAAADAVAGTENFADITPTDIIQVDASSVGAWSLAANGGPTISVEAASDADANKFNLRVKYLGNETVYENLNTQAGQDNLASVIGDDVANLIVVTKLADGRPLNAADQPLLSGSDGTLVSADYIAGITDLANAQGPAVCLIAEASVDQTALNNTIVTLAAAASDRIFVTWSGVNSQVPSANIASLATDITTRSDRIVWCYNTPKTIDPETAVKINQGPHVWMAAILANTDVDIHPGSVDASSLLAGVSELDKETLTRADLISLRDAGISTLEKTPEGFAFRSGIVTSLVTGKTEITRRRSADFLQLSASDRLKFFVKVKNTIEARAQMGGELVAFSQSLKDQDRIIEDFAVEQESVNTPAQRAKGIEKILWRVRLIGHILHLVLETEIGTGVVIES